MTVEQRFWTKVDKSGGPDACWPWTGAMAGSGYGVFRVGSKTDGSRRMIGAHQFACELAHGPLKPGDEPHHTCHTKRCCNGAHLVAMTKAQHLREHKQDRIENARKNSRHPNFVGASARARAAKPRCRNGHAFNEANTMMIKGERVCRTCSKAAGIRRRIKKGQNVAVDVRRWLADFERESAAYRSKA